jgi:hypothetical protein
MDVPFSYTFSYLGFDIDQKNWDSSLYYASDHDVKESLAQYYTERVMASLKEKIPGGFNAYEELRENQPESYKKHVPWIKHSTPESVRNALIIFRSNNSPVKFQAFEEALKRITETYKRDQVNKN